MPTAFIKVYGKVQGVFFRHFTVIKANELGVTGFVLNAADGTVEITTQASQEKLDEFIRWCHHGPERARVDKVEVRFVEENSSFHSFEVRYD
ncbi:MAG TPA: acylphosphatase [Bacteroidia bacterium]|nr:acylphosphatase [Bacteroidia bacterium]